MKGKIAAVIILFALFGCGLSPKSLSDREQLGLNADVQSMNRSVQSADEIVYTVIKFNPEGFITSIDYQSPNHAFSHRIIVETDSEGRLLNKIRNDGQNTLLVQESYDYSGDPIEYEYTEYDPSGLVTYKERNNFNQEYEPIETDAYYSDGSENTTETYLIVKDASGQSETIIAVDNNGKTNEVIYRDYDANGNLNIETLYDENENLVYRLIHTYNENQKLIEEEYRFGDNEIYTYYVHTYEKDKMTSTEYSETWNGTDQSGIIYYDYDSEGNIIRKDTYDSDGTLLSLTEYEYEYY